MPCFLSPGQFYYVELSPFSVLQLETRIQNSLSLHVLYFIQEMNDDSKGWALEHVSTSMMAARFFTVFQELNGKFYWGGLIPPLNNTWADGIVATLDEGSKVDAAQFTDFRRLAKTAVLLWMLL